MTIDRMLPGIDGIAVIRQPARRRHCHAGVDHQRARRDRRSGARSARRRRRLSRQAVCLRGTAGARRGAGRRSDTVVKGNSAAGRRSRARPGVADGEPSAAATSSFCRANFSCSNIWCATKARSFPRHAAAARLGPSFRSLDQYHRRLCRSRPSQGRRPAGLSADPHDSRRGVLCPCSLLRPFVIDVQAGADRDRHVRRDRSVALFGYVYHSTAAYVRSRSDRAIAAESAALQGRFRCGTLTALIAAIGRRIADPSFADGAICLLTDSSMTPARRQSRGMARDAWRRCGMGRWQRARACGPARARPALLRAQIETLSDGSRLLVGRDIDDLDEFVRTDQHCARGAIVLIFVLAGGGEHLGDAPYRWADRIDQRDEPRDHAKRPWPANTAARHAGRMGSACRKPQFDA